MSPSGSFTKYAIKHDTKQCLSVTEGAAAVSF